MQYVGLQTQIWNNNLKSTILLIMFPVVLLGLSWLFFYLTMPGNSLNEVNRTFLGVAPWITVGVLIWFLIAWFANTAIIRSATGARTLERRENKRVYNLVENLCIATGTRMPKINIIEDNSLNAFASGISDNTYTVTLSRGIINNLNDEELEGVIAHELTHIRNKDVRLLIVSIIFVGIFAFLVEILLRSFFYSGMRRTSRRDDKGRAIGMLIALVLAIAGFLITSLFRFAISRKREYMADAGAAQMTKRPRALASALRKVSGNSRIEAVTRKDVAQLFIDNPPEPKKDLFSFFNGLFATHPPIDKRIAVLEQF
jgi:heat shock protein HtpX